MSSSANPAPPVPETSPNGLEHPGVIDLLAHDGETDEVNLVMMESRPWSGSEEQLFQLQEKINAYLSFALDGEMAEAYPTLVGKHLRIILQCRTAPDAVTAQMLDVVREQIAFQGIDLDVVAADSMICGSCGCGEGECH